ncbi:hypothetical protein V1289_002790 [Bradyrhizobium sp. AZCC 2289]
MRAGVRLEIGRRYQIDNELQLLPTQLRFIPDEILFARR